MIVAVQFVWRDWGKLRSTTVRSFLTSLGHYIKKPLTSSQAKINTGRMGCTTCSHWPVYRKCVSVAEFVPSICMILYGPLLIWKLCKYIDYVPFQPFCCHWKPVLRRLTQYVWVQYAGYWDRGVSNGLHCECWSNPFRPKRNKYRTYFIDASFVSRGRALYSHQARVSVGYMGRFYV